MNNSLPVESALPDARCAHCALPIPSSRKHLANEESYFCCTGCKAVYAYIHDLGLADFYRIRASSWLRPAIKQSGEASKYLYLDDDACRSKYVQRTAEPGTAEVTFALEGIHCAACVWLLEKLPYLTQGVRSCRVRLTSGTIQITFEESTRLSDLALAVRRLGYVPHPVALGERGFLLEERTMLLRIGVAAVSVMNTMLYAVSLYQGWLSGMEPRFVSLFTWMSFLLCLPTVLYSAVPFYRTALSGIRAQTLHIDLPLSSAILLAFAMSAWNTVRGSDVVYFDTLSMLVFLLLVARFLQKRGLDSAREACDLQGALVPLSARRIPSPDSSPYQEEEVYIESVEPGDYLRVHAGERIPTDGSIVSGISTVNESVLTGESTPIPIATGSKVLGGSVNIDSTIVLSAATKSSESHAGKLLQLLESGGQQQSRRGIADRSGGFFVFTVLVVALLTAAFWYSRAGLDAALGNTLAVLVISCPCALGLASPLALSLAVRRAATAGILIKRSEAVETLAASTLIVFDKTGTITEGRPQVSAIWHEEMAEMRFDPNCKRFPHHIASVVGALERDSRHPFGREILRLSMGWAAPIEERREVDGGVEGKFRGETWIVGSPGLLIRRGIVLPLVHGTSSVVWVARGDRCVAGALLTDTIRVGMRELIEDLERSGRRAVMLSGDSQEVSRRVGREIGIREAQGGLSPEEKQRLVSQLARGDVTAMFGDGANDAPALQAAAVSVGVAGGAEVCLRTADIYLSNPTAEHYGALIRGAAQTVNVVRLCLGVSLVYNVCGTTLAVLGYVNPLVAAILMPISSLSVFLITTGGVRFNVK